MSNLLMLALCLLAGALLRRSGRVADRAHPVLNAVIIHLSLPAATLRYLNGFRIDADTLASVLMPWALGRALMLPRASIGALTLVGGRDNTSFVGLPMIESLQGDAASTRWRGGI